MSNLKEELLKKLASCVVEMEDEEVIDIANEYIANEFEAYEGISKGLAAGMEEAGKLYEEEEYYIPELLLCSDAMYEGINILKPHLKKDSTKESYKAVVGVVEGDTHDIGKNLFKIMLETSGFEVYDLGRDVPCEEFINKAKELDADLIGLSTLMTTTMDNMQKIINMLKEEDIRDEFVVMVGGGPISQSFANKIGADGYAHEASKASKLAKELINKKKATVKEVV
ncbi:corrinoid protein [Romboutsia lituseburensis]|uniref:Methylmalonyl-CoA mutase C-terminal domain-containing protein/methyltransferase cognate corrinoid proteins n=1 Tax=Romboutsia lituseburensis DSM 797 TaxID=1121325 RepID=A0A1G9LFN2_9FIRM|nr:corrinoid protein [Romboutsia lituseburensis]CEH35287.1 Dimethylamine corrinoid protein 1 [Romboutsia lituseburensis]SDL60587.1 methylmalonyl-CoA mutase C-terminal domain-containing protein/methyltransferase cognate corrinoid proteins [Romboutsia lituseburensis DSM 797]